MATNTIDNQARRELILACIAVTLIISVSIYIYESEDNRLKQDLALRKCEVQWLAAVIADSNPDTYNRLQPITQGKTSAEIAATERCRLLFRDNQE